ncbi:hypothetical protein AGABI1DRAFT_94341 [Agaricus bisporus var. burnettii JB137-S8]|uniref:Uncharacterized protein n=1 Tax=Agaricus bisporus var. burnettii (strain JB137-S8 / ATCC MYA-4627 / FGSC 10392) TaxID=597362 RepID=K5WZ00_AGABU|nr:uncharacterized protein AGABI1DRAFT_94341 [Agaricus bisporus var. burnettii JB137-S8]EKM76053.1 hypothetical protein AGABI1DRAFT_94341 [Agaricus bisporus var. burnettii JB137-S8]
MGTISYHAPFPPSNDTSRLPEAQNPLFSLATPRAFWWLGVWKGEDWKSTRRSVVCSGRYDLNNLESCFGANGQVSESQIAKRFAATQVGLGSQPLAQAMATFLGWDILYFPAHMSREFKPRESSTPFPSFHHVPFDPPGDADLKSIHRFQQDGQRKKRKKARKVSKEKEGTAHKACTALNVSVLLDGGKIKKLVKRDEKTRKLNGVSNKKTQNSGGPPTELFVLYVRLIRRSEQSLTRYLGLTEP